MRNTIDLRLIMPFILSEFELRECCRMSPDEICSSFTRPRIERINKLTRQEIEPKYWAYLIEFYLRQLGMYEGKRCE